MLKHVEKEIEKVEVSGLAALLGENVVLLCMNYIYFGKLIGIDDNDVLLESAHIVYETGDWNNESWKDAQKLPNQSEWGVKLCSVESYGKVEMLL